MPFAVAAVSYAILYLVARLVARFRPRWLRRLLIRVRSSNDFVKLVVFSVLLAAPLALSLLIVAGGDHVLLVGASFAIFCAIPLCVLGLPLLWRARRDRRVSVRLDA
jgi:hypothetical protein